MQYLFQTTTWLFASTFLLCLHVRAIHGDFTCDPVTDCLNSIQGGLVPDPADCTAYYICVGSGSDLIPSDSSIKCANGQYFDGSTGACTKETTAGVCDVDYCHPQSNGVCRTSCFNDYEVIGYPGDCSKFYECDPGALRVGTCLYPTIYFDGETCVESPDACCDFCNSYCFNAGALVADPYICTKFYNCSAVGEVDQQYHYTCPLGEHFDAPSAICVAGAACTSMCNAV